MNNIEVSIALATAPSSAFAELRERPRFWFPLLLVILTTAGLVAWYYSIVDIEWFKDALYANNPEFQKMSEDQKAGMLNMLGRKTLLVSGVIGSLFVLPILFLLQSVYLLVAGKVTKLSPAFKHWFAMSCWSSLPALIGTVVAAILMLMSDTNQISPTALQALSLNELIFHKPLGSPGQALLDSLHIPGFLGWILMIIGVRVWSQRSWLFSTLFILVPLVVIYGIWAFFAFR